MKKIVVFAFLCLLALSCLAEAAEMGKDPASKKPKPTPCASCHETFADLLDTSHPKTKAASIGECLTCHKRKEAGKPIQRPFAAKLHRSHINETISLECTTCHTWSPGKGLGFPGQKVSFGKISGPKMSSLKKVFLSWGSSANMDGLHSTKNVTCSSCHGETVAETGDLVENERCLQCHGPLDKLAKKTAPKDFPDRNPHFSHLGEIDCTVCHKGHSASSVYCLGCHKNFTMKIPGG